MYSFANNNDGGRVHAVETGERLYTGRAQAKLIDQVLQVNIRAGQLLKANEAGDRFLHVPVKPQGLSW